MINCVFLQQDILLSVLPLHPTLTACVLPSGYGFNLAGITDGILFVREFNTVSPQARELCVSLSLSQPLPLLLFLRITKWLTFMTDTTVAKRAEIFILILMKTGIFERKNAIIVATFNETQSQEDKVVTCVYQERFVQYYLLFCYLYFWP